MKVALVAHYLGPQLGIGQYVDRLVPPLTESLLERGADYKIFASPNAISQTRALLNAKQGELIEVPELDLDPIKRYLWVATRFSRFCRLHSVDAVLWLSNPMVLPWHPRTISVIHDVNEWKNDDKGWFRTRLRSLIYLHGSFRFSDAVVAVSQATADDIQRIQPDLSKRTDLHAIVNGADSGLTGEAPVDVPSPNAPFLLSVGRIDPNGKRLPEAVKLVDALRRHTGRPWELHLVGGFNQSTAEQGRAFLEDVEATAWISYHGHVTNQALAEWYRRSTAVVFLAEDEGFGLPIAEAVSFGRYAIISHRNIAGIEAGASGVIPIDITDIDLAAKNIVHSMSEPPQAGFEPLTTWKQSASRYAELLTGKNPMTFVKRIN